MDELDFNQVLASKRHKELTNALNNVLNKVNDKTSTDPIVQELKKIVQALTLSLKQNNNTDVIRELKNLQDIIAEAESTPSPTKWVFKVRRNLQGYIESVEAYSE